MEVTWFNINLEYETEVKFLYKECFKVRTKRRLDLAVLAGVIILSLILITAVVTNLVFKQNVNIALLIVAIMLEVSFVIIGFSTKEKILASTCEYDKLADTIDSDKLKSIHDIVKSNVATFICSNYFLVDLLLRERVRSATYLGGELTVEYIYSGEKYEKVFLADKVRGKGEYATVNISRDSIEVVLQSTVSVLRERPRVYLLGKGVQS